MPHPPQKSFRDRLLIYIFLIGFVPLLIWAVFAYLGSANLVSRFLEREIQYKVDEVAAKLEMIKSQNGMLLKTLSQELARHNLDEWDSILSDLTASVSEIYGAHVVDANGDAVARSDRGNNLNYSDRNFFREARENEPTYEIVHSKKYKKAALCSAMVLPRSPTHRKVYRVAICRLMDSFLADLARLQIGRSGYLFAVNREGRMLSHPRLPFESTEMPPLEKRILEVSGKGSDQVQNFDFVHEGEHYTGYSRRLDNGWHLLALHHQTELLTSATDFLIWPIGLGVLAFALVALLVGFGVSRLTRPLRQLTYATRHLGPDNLRVRLPVESGDELGSLAQSFNDMATRLDQAFSALQEKESELERSKADLERQVLEQSEKLLYSTKMSSLGEMAGGIAHEVNNPLAIISLRTQRLKEQIERGEMNREVILESLEKIESTCLRINQIVRALRAFSRDGSKDPMLLENLSSIVAEAVALCSEFLKTHGIRLEVDCPESIEIECQPIQIAQVLLNLLTNARDAVIERKQPWIRLEAKVIGRDVELSVTDNGPGISKDVQDKIMQPFFTTKNVGSGTGLGLSISKGIVQQHHGDLFFNKESEYTQFVMRLPLRQPEAETKPI